jgi:hypothetical protein
MGLKFENLDPETRKFMIEEIEMDAASDKIYRSSYLGQRAQGSWPDLLRAAAESGNDDSLAAELHKPGMLNQTTQRRKPNGGYTIAKVPYTAPETLAEGEFNRYFCRGLCSKALLNGVARLEVYRAKAVANPRPESERKIGLLVDPVVVLIDLRVSQGVEPALGIPPGPNSGITLRIPSA